MNEMKRIAIMGAGNMGGALARGFAANLSEEEFEIRVSNPSVAKLELLHSDFPRIQTFTDNMACAENADIIVIAVKPWIEESVLRQLEGISAIGSGTVVISLVAGDSFDNIRKYVGDGPEVFLAIPNTAVSVCKGMTFVSTDRDDKEAGRLVSRIFDAVGMTEIVPLRMLNGGMAVASCGIAFMMRFLRAMTEGGVELGLYPATALRAAAQTMLGASELIEKGGGHPEAEVDKVTTAGGLTIRGLNAMEEAGFTGSVLKGLRACLKN